MDAFQSSYDHHAFLFWLVLAVALALVALWTLRTALSTRRLEGELHDILGGLSGDNTARMLTEYLGTVRTTAAAMNRMKEEHDRIVDLIPGVVRHVGLVRFSPFHDTGGDQSFTLAVLDGRRNGVIITGLHSRNDSRLYAKPIERGESSYSLTPEEREAMSRALSGDTAGVPS
jgi:hypothetical protein